MSGEGLELKISERVGIHIVSPVGSHACWRTEKVYKRIFPRLMALLAGRVTQLGLVISDFIQERSWRSTPKMLIAGEILWIAKLKVAQLGAFKTLWSCTNTRKRPMEGLKKRNLHGRVTATPQIAAQPVTAGTNWNITFARTIFRSFWILVILEDPVKQSKITPSVVVTKRRLWRCNCYAFRKIPENERAIMMDVDIPAQLNRFWTNMWHLDMADNWKINT
jgi:hypothetical protein